MIAKEEEWTTIDANQTKEKVSQAIEQKIISFIEKT